MKFPRMGPESWSALVVALCGAGIIAVVPSQVDRSGDEVGVTGATLPYAFGTLILVFALSLLWDALRGKGGEGRREGGNGTGGARPWAPWVGAAALIVHVLLFPVLGYWIATASVLVVLGWLYGLRPGWTFLALVVLIPLAIFGLVEKMLIILLPRGWWGW
ncbi:MAG: tripartite tricarboxylate transporter TctB family protein [Candidatus Methylomirabilia bacterium]